MLKIGIETAISSARTLEDVYRIAVESKAKNLSRSSMETYRAAWRQLEPMKNALVSELKPVIDHEYRTWPHREASVHQEVLEIISPRWFMNAEMPVFPHRAMSRRVSIARRDE